MTDATAVPINLFENDRELMVVAPMPGVSPEDISIDVTDDGQLTVRVGAARRGPGADPLPPARVVVRSVRADDRAAVRGRCATRANVTYGNGVLSITFPKADATSAGRVLVQPHRPHARDDRRPQRHARRRRDDRLRRRQQRDHLA